MRADPKAVCFCAFLFVLMSGAYPAWALDRDKPPTRPYSDKSPPQPEKRPELNESRFAVEKWDGKFASWKLVQQQLKAKELNNKICSGNLGGETTALITILKICESSTDSSQASNKAAKADLKAELKAKLSDSTVVEYVEARIKGELADWLLSETLGAVCRDSGLNYFPSLCMLRGQQLYTSDGIDRQVPKALHDDLQTLPAYAIYKMDKGATWGYVLTNAIVLMENEDPRAVVAALADQTELRDTCNKNESRNCSLWTIGLLTQAYLATEKDCEENSNPNNCRKERKEAKHRHTSLEFWRQFAGRVVYLYLTKGSDAFKADQHVAYDRLEWLSGRLNSLLGAVKKNTAQPPQAVERLATYSQRVEDTFDRIAALPVNANAKIDAVRKKAKEEGRNLTEAEKKEIADISEQSKRELAAIRAKLLEAAAGYLYVMGLALLDEEQKPSLFGYENFFGRLYLVYKSAEIVGQFQAPKEQNRFRAAAELLLCLGADPSLEVRDKDELCPSELPIALDPAAITAINHVGRDLIFIADLADRFVALTGDDPVKKLGDRWGEVGLYKQKRRYLRSSIGMLAGLGVGRERTSGSSVNAYNGRTLGVSAPVGLDIVWSRNLGLFVSALDLGNLLTERVSGKSNDQVSSTETNTSLSALRSYGAYVRWWWKDTPLVLFLGASYSPNLRTADLSGGGSQKVNSTRITAGVALELPFFLY